MSRVYEALRRADQGLGRRNRRSPVLGHPEASQPYLKVTTSIGRRVYEHILIAQRALGRSLPPKANVHHVDGNVRNNANRNLVICQDMAYHKLLHMRARAVRDGVNPNTERRCTTCGQIKPFHCFQRRAANTTALNSRCADCCYQSVVRHRQRKREAEALRLSDDLPDDPADRVAQVIRWALRGARDEG